jgi:phosphoglucosamine mutase
MKKLFGTDGIRGVAGEFPFDRPTVQAIGRALAMNLPSGAGVVLGRDTRESGEWISQTLASAMAAGGVKDIAEAGVVTTPGLAYLTRRDAYQMGIMISASHNPYQDNGIKVFSSDGFKLPDEAEIGIEKCIEALLEKGETREPVLPLSFKNQQEPNTEYLSFLVGNFHGSLAGYRIGMDVCNGAAFQIAPQVFRQLGAELEIINDQPDGRNINLQCGSLHLNGLIQRVVDSKLDFGIAFDGDADRSLFATPSGQVFDGDCVLNAFASHWKSTGELKAGKVVGTLMTNYALEKALRKQGLELIRAAVGDKYVLEEMNKSGANLGGEPSGHIILRDYHTTGDGILTAVKLAELLAAEKTDLDHLSKGYHPFPQILIGLQVKEKVPLDSSPRIQDLLKEAESKLKESGRLVVRYSGTEPLLRIMAEGEDEALVREIVDHLKNEFLGLLS